MNGKPDRNAWALALLRIVVGLLFLTVSSHKVLGTQFTLGGGMQSSLGNFLSGGRAYPFMIWILRDFVLVHPKAISFLVAYGELAIGLGLVLGILVRTASTFGLIYVLAILFSSNYPGAQAPFLRYISAGMYHLLFAFCFLAFLFGNADQALALWPRVRRRRSPEQTPPPAGWKFTTGS